MVDLHRDDGDVGIKIQTRTSSVQCRATRAEVNQLVVLPTRQVCMRRNWTDNSQVISMIRRRTINPERPVVPSWSPVGAPNAGKATATATATATAIATIATG